MLVCSRSYCLPGTCTTAIFSLILQTLIDSRYLDGMFGVWVYLWSSGCGYTHPVHLA